MPALYFAALLFSESELAFNAALTAEIERLGFAVFLPLARPSPVGRGPRTLWTPDLIGGT